MIRNSDSRSRSSDPADMPEDMYGNDVDDREVELDVLRGLEFMNDDIEELHDEANLAEETDTVKTDGRNSSATTGPMISLSFTMIDQEILHQ